MPFFLVVSKDGDQSCVVVHHHLDLLQVVVLELALVHVRGHVQLLLALSELSDEVTVAVEHFLR